MARKPWHTKGSRLHLHGKGAAEQQEPALAKNGLSKCRCLAREAVRSRTHQSYFSAFRNKHRILLVYNSWSGEAYLRYGIWLTQTLSLFAALVITGARTYNPTKPVCSVRLDCPLYTYLSSVHACMPSIDKEKEKATHRSLSSTLENILPQTSSGRSLQPPYSSLHDQRCIS